MQRMNSLRRVWRYQRGNQNVLLDHNKMSLQLFRTQTYCKVQHIRPRRSPYLLYIYMFWTHICYNKVSKMCGTLQYVGVRNNCRLIWLWSNKTFWLPLWYLQTLLNEFILCIYYHITKEKHVVSLNDYIFGW
jgi:hypothetical protein